MFEFTRRVGFGVNIGNLFEFQRPFQSDWVMCPAGQKQRVCFVAERFRHLGNFALDFQNFFQRTG